MSYLSKISQGRVSSRRFDKQSNDVAGIVRIWSVLLITSFCINGELRSAFASLLTS